MTEIIPPIPEMLKAKYKLSDDSIIAVNQLVEFRVRSELDDFNIEEILLKKYTEQLDKYMMKQYPDLSNRLNSLSLVLDEQAKLLEKGLKGIEKREKAIIKSESLYKDFYDLKDRVKVLDDFIVTFKSKLKKAFDI